MVTCFGHLHNCKGSQNVIFKMKFLPMILRGFAVKRDDGCFVGYDWLFDRFVSSPCQLSEVIQLPTDNNLGIYRN